jgi:oxalate decarboxylase/phosphoglucose isomerase-like protein (cupin superfamily)
MEVCAIQVICFAVLVAISFLARADGESKPSLPVFDPKTGKLPSPCCAVYTPALPMREVTGTPHHHHMKTNSAVEYLGLKNLPIYFDTQRYSPGGYQEPKGHPGTWHLLYVLEGQGEFLIGDVVYKICPGTWCYIPEGAVHAARNTGKGDLVLLFVGRADAASKREEKAGKSASRKA